MSTRGPNGAGPPAGHDDDELDAGFAAFAAALRSELAPVATAPDRIASTRARAHAALRGPTAPPSARARPRLYFLVEASTALAAGAIYVVWTIKQLWPR